MTYQNLLTPDQIQRLRAYGTEAPRSFPVADHAPSVPAPARRRRPTYDAAKLGAILDGLNEVGRGIAAAKAAFTARQARATADAAARATGRLTQAEQAEALRHSHAVADAAAAPNAISRINARAAEVWKRPNA